MSTTKRQIFLDTETTGLESSKGHRILEIACVEMIGRRLTHNNFQRYVNPEREIDVGAQQIHGISAEFLADKPKWAEIADDLLTYLGDAELVIHNAPFDLGFVNAELALMGRPPINIDRLVTDTLAMAREQYPGRKSSLDALCERFEVDNSARTHHGALLDAELLAEVYLAMTRGQDSLAIGIDGGGGRQSGEPVKRVRPATLKVIVANADELALHAQMRERLQKASGGKAVWAQIEPAT